MKPAIAITVGDYNGIGPEVVLKSLTNNAVLRVCSPILVGPRNVFWSYAHRLGLHFHERATPIIESSRTSIAAISPGSISGGAGAAAARAIEEAVRLAQRGIVQAIVTAPVSKQALHRAGMEFPGQTEMLQQLTSSKSVAMMMVSSTMRVGLITIHEPMRKVAGKITRKLLRERITLFHRALIWDWRIPRPRIAVLGLNPHAGEGGHIGSEERSVIVPTIRSLRAKNMDLHGPFPADSFFGQYVPGTYDAIIAMYHDQGLIPLKMSSFKRSVNVSVGLPIIRTSPDHGTAFDIAGKGTADARGMTEAIKLAAHLASARRQSAARGRKNIR
jgi:4-phospho-D-threonate 3-dehydrogenase / 4-phospho-D-erythronate 3-dehydrogenase